MNENADFGCSVGISGCHRLPIDGQWMSLISNVHWDLELILSTAKIITAKAVGESLQLIGTPRRFCKRIVVGRFWYRV